MARGVTRASALHGQLGLPESGAAALWDTAADACCPPLEVEGEVRATQGGMVHVEPINLTLKPPGTERLKPEYGEMVSNFGFRFNLRLYSKARRTPLRYI